MRRHHSHLRAMPTGPRQPECVSPGRAAQSAGRDDRRQTATALMTALADKEEIVAGLQERLDEVAEDRDAWRLRALSAEAQLRRPSVAAALYALVAMGWQNVWGQFESERSVAGEAT